LSDVVDEKYLGGTYAKIHAVGCVIQHHCVHQSRVAQNTNSGDISCTVTDPSGAIIPDVTVTIKDVDKDVTKTFVMDGAGLYDTGSIVPDHYLITFTKDGFTTLVRGPNTLEVGPQTINAQLKVGSTSQQVVVRTDVPLIQTETGAQEATLSSETMAQLPQVGADWENFVTFLPGVAGTLENASNTTTPGQVSSVDKAVSPEFHLAQRC
jgi:Carboxypeptidase regulatory-like domain